MKKVNKPRNDEMLAEYDFRGGVRGKYAGRFSGDTVMIALEPDVAESFPDAKSVNEALRLLIRVSASSRKAPVK
ncbi:MAG TPA: hypothetical protein PLJ47_18430, partial [Candidatus Hydrogenedentes bacterium]|nr:hypothetical protein [Candidatus Hydrogenedentota bacterium]